jgi:hypothetical protein
MTNRINQTEARDYLVSLSNGGRKKPLPTQEEIDSYQTYMNSED